MIDYPYKWRIYQMQTASFNYESDRPCAMFFHEEEARISFDYLCDRYHIRFVLTNARTGESYVG